MQTPATLHWTWRHRHEELLATPFPDTFRNTATVQHPILRRSAARLGTQFARRQRQFGFEYGAPAASSVLTDYRLKGLLSNVKQATYAHSEFYGL